MFPVWEESASCAVSRRPASKWSSCRLNQVLTDNMLQKMYFLFSRCTKIDVIYLFSSKKKKNDLHPQIRREWSMCFTCSIDLLPIAMRSSKLTHIHASVQKCYCLTLFDAWAKPSYCAGSGKSRHGPSCMQ